MLRGIFVTLTSLAVAFVALAGASPVAAQSYGVAYHTEACGTHSDYSTAGGTSIYLNPGTTCNSTVSGPGFTGVVTGPSGSDTVFTNPGTAVGRTSAAGSVNGVGVCPSCDGPSNIGNTYRVSASASLARGTLSVSGGMTVANGNNPESICCLAADAEMFDTLTFAVAGAKASTVTIIPFTYRASESGRPSRFWGSSLAFNTNDTFSFGCGGPVAACVGWSAAPGLTDNPPSDIVLSGGINSASSVTFNAPSLVTNNGFVVSGILTVDGASATVDIAEQVYLDTNGDFVSVDPDLTFRAPGGTALTSASGVFDTAPEPSTWITLLLGFAGIGGSLRMCRRPVQVPGAR